MLCKPIGISLGIPVILTVNLLALGAVHRSGSMKLLLHIFLFFTAFGSNYGEMCADNCFCQEDEAECTITSCSLLELDTSYGSLVIHGTLCPEQRLFLEGITDATFVNLIDDSCGYIPNCRQVFSWNLKCRSLIFYH